MKSIARTMSAPLLLVGFQRGVRRALRSVGRPALALVPEGAPLPSTPEVGAPEVAAARQVDLHGPSEPVEEAARELVGDRRPAAVVALAERTVLVAARLRERFGVPGTGPSAALACADKVAMKRAMEAAGVPVTRWREVGAATRADELARELGLPFVLKPRRDSGGRGQRKVEDRGAAAEVLEELRAKGGFERGFGWLAERWIEGEEMSIESFVQAGRPLFENPTEYFVHHHANILPAPIAPKKWEALRELNAQALRAAGVARGITHLELFRTRAGPVFGELAARPPGGRLMTLLRRAWRFDPWEAMLRLELGEAFPFPGAPRRTAGAWILHPGPGTVASIEGVEEARALPHVRRIALKVAPGRAIPERTGSGQDVGAIYAEGPDRDAVARALSDARGRIVIARR